MRVNLDFDGVTTTEITPTADNFAGSRAGQGREKNRPAVRSSMTPRPRQRKLWIWRRGERGCVHAGEKPIAGSSGRSAILFPRPHSQILSGTPRRQGYFVPRPIFPRPWPARSPAKPCPTLFVWKISTTRRRVAQRLLLSAEYRRHAWVHASWAGTPCHPAAAGNRVRVRAEIGVVLRIAPPQAASPQPSQSQGGDFGPQRPRTRFPAAADFVERREKSCRENKKIEESITDLRLLILRIRAICEICG